MKQQQLLAKIGEVKFRQKLTLQHQGYKKYYPMHTTGKEMLKLLRKRVDQSSKIFKQLNNKKIPLSPFLEIGGEKGERSAVLTSKMKAWGAIVDLSAHSLASATYFCPKIGLKKLPQRICADVYKLPFLNNSFNFIFVFQTLHHFPDPLPIMKEIYRVLAPGGCFYFDEEPVKQVFNLALWRRDYHLRWWEKTLKVFLILPFISKIGKAEVDAGILEETFDLKTWERALNVFDQVQAELLPYPCGPITKVKKKSLKWLKPKLGTKIMIDLLGGGIKGLCKKKGLAKANKTNNIIDLLGCPECQAKISKKGAMLQCNKCHQFYPIKKNIWYLLKHQLHLKLYP